MKKAIKKKTDVNAEEKIKEAARSLFTQKGFAATKTRDIAEEAGINLALLNYYFRSKENLFDIIMLENFEQFIRGLALILGDEKIPVQEKIQRLINSYIDMLTKEPDLPLFMLNALRNDPSALIAKMEPEIGPARTYFEKQISQEIKSGKMPAPSFNPMHIIVNVIGLTIFPFVARPLLMRRVKINDKEFNALMEERKALIPKWLEAMMKVK